MILSGLVAAVLLVLMGRVVALRPDAAPPDDSDESIVGALGLGDRAALGQLFRRFHGPVYRFLSRYLGPGSPDLDDLVQNTFLEAQRAAAQFQGRSAVQTWLIGIAANLAWRHVRGETRRRAFLRRSAAMPLAPDPRIDELTAQQQTLLRLQAMIQELPPDLRAAFVMCDLEQIPGVDAARSLGVPAGTLWRRLHEARRLLRDALQGERP